MMFLGCHLVDLIYRIQGEPLSVKSYCRSSGADGTSCDDFGFTVFEYPNGVSFAKTFDVEVGGFDRRQLVVCGSEKTVELKPLEVIVDDSLIYTDKTEHTDKEKFTARGAESKVGNFDRYDTMMSSFAEMVRGEKENPYTYDYELSLYKTVLRACGQYKEVTE